ncbi:hypothetical protein HMPREF3031_11590 [Staphylococcus sp. HMSC072B07]|nr:hypothetical protein HMPREF3031_11590 [Staphylococcus sp. HMSC072B07]OHR08197.1 hypothetical protein HMPREF2721_05680 [Staphylococcus sp. HMSC078A12]
MTHCWIIYQSIGEYILVVFSYKLAEVEANLYDCFYRSFNNLCRSIENRIRLYPKKGWPTIIIVCKNDKDNSQKFDVLEFNKMGLCTRNLNDKEKNKSTY